MHSNYHSKNFDTQQARGQFLLTAEPRVALPEWNLHEWGKWRLYTQALPVVPVYDESKQQLGWCIGHLIIGGQLHPELVTLQTAGLGFSMNMINDFTSVPPGNGHCFSRLPGYDAIFLDPYGSLAAVYGTTEKTIASTPTLIGTNNDWDEELIRAIGLPENDVWLPSGTYHKKKCTAIAAKPLAEPEKTGPWQDIGQRRKQIFRLTRIPQPPLKIL